MMEEPQETDIKISDLFKEYKKFVAGDMEVEGREIVIEDNAEYEAMDVHFEFEEEGERSCTDESITLRGKSKNLYGYDSWLFS